MPALTVAHTAALDKHLLWQDAAGQKWMWSWTFRSWHKANNVCRAYRTSEALVAAVGTLTACGRNPLS